MQIQDRKESFEGIARPSIWSQSGPFFLLGTFAVLIYKCAHFFWPLLMIAFIGYTANLIWKKRGFYFSFVVLLAAALFTIFRGVDPFWSSILAASIGFSWLLIFLGRQEIDCFFEKSEEKAAALSARSQSLEEQLHKALNSLSEGNKEKIAEREHLNRLYAETAQSLSQIQRSLEVSEKEGEKLEQKCQLLSEDIFAHQRKEIAFQHALDDAQTQLIQFKNQQKAEPIGLSIIPQEENGLQEQMQLSQVQHQYTLLRKQFEEKSEALDKTRKDLFHMENVFLALQKSQGENALEVSGETLGLMKELKELDEQCSDLETQVLNLQEIITALSAPKKRVVRSRKLRTREDLPDLIQGKIDEMSSMRDSK